MSEFSIEKLKNYLIEAGGHLKASSLGHRVRCIRSLFKWAYDEGVISKNPATKLKEPKLGKRIPKFLSELEVIQSLLGHEKSETTKIYTQLNGKLRHDFYSKHFCKLLKTIFY